MRSDIAPGAVFPDYELPDHTGKTRHLSEIQAGDPMIIVLAREAYSAKDQRQHEGLVQLWREIDIPEYTDPAHNQMVPHTIVCEPGLVIYKIYNGYWFLGRPTVEELRLDLRAVLMKSHWDWDLSDPAVREAWERGEN